MKLSDTLKTKTDQLNFDDLALSGPKIINITKAVLKESDQPLALSYKDDKGKPYKPGKAMRFVLHALWGDDEQKFVGRSLKVYPDPTITFGKVEVGGIRISDMTDIKGDCVVMITVGRGRKIEHHIKKLVLKDEKEEKALAWVSSVIAKIIGCANAEELEAFKTENKKALDSLTKYENAQNLLEEAYRECEANFAEVKTDEN